MEARFPMWCHAIKQRAKVGNYGLEDSFWKNLFTSDECNIGRGSPESCGIFQPQKNSAINKRKTHLT